MCPYHDPLVPPILLSAYVSLAIVPIATMSLPLCLSVCVTGEPLQDPVGGLRGDLETAVRAAQLLC